MRECRSQPVNVELWFLLVPNCTSIMLIVTIILFTSGICFATNVVPSTRASVTSATSIKSKRVVVDPGHNIRNNQEQARGGAQTTSRIPSPQDINLRSSPRYGNAKATDTQRMPYISTNQPGSYAYGSVPKHPLSYVSSPSHQIKAEQSRSNLLAPYFDVLNNPDAYKTARSVEKPLDASKSIVPQSLQKLQGIYSPSYNAFYQDKPIELASFSNFEYPSYTGVSKLLSQGDIQNDVSPSSVQAPTYKMTYPVSKITDYAQLYAPNIPTGSSVTPSSDKTIQNLKQKTEVTIDVNGKKISVPIIQLQSNLDFSGVLPAFDSQPFLLSANYPIESDVGFKFGTGPKFNMALQSSNVSPFSSPLSSFQGQVVPIQTTNGNSQFPLYKGASIEAYPVASNVPKAQGNYESLYSQPQLHFDKELNGNVQPVNVRQNTAHPSVSTQGILNDAELVNKKNPEPHTPQPDDDDRDEDREDERYKNSDKEQEHSFEDENDENERQSRQYFKAPPTESDFKPSTSYPFKAYDEVFGKLRAQSDDDDDDFEDKPFSSYKNYSSDDDEEEEDPSSEDRAEYTESSSPSHDSYEEEDEEEEESRKQEKRKKANEGSYEVEPNRSKYYQKDFEQEFENSYKEELPKQEYVHVKEVPEIDSYISSKPSKRQQKNSSQSRVKHGQPKELKSQESRVSQKNRKLPKMYYKDSTAFSSDIFTEQSPKVIYEEFYGYKKPETKKYSKRAKTEKFSPTKKSQKEDGYSQKYYKFKSSKTGSALTSKDKDPNPYFSNNWKLNKNSSEKTVTNPNVRQLSDSGNRASLSGPSILSGQMRSLTNAEIFRDLTGI